MGPVLGPLTSVVGVLCQNPAKSLAIIKKYLQAKFYRDRTGSLDFYREQTNRRTNIALCILDSLLLPGNTKGGSITVLLTSRLTGLVLAT
jgi:hypothetical protein